jgi:phage terminase large subunit GpA-like protein
MHDLEQVFREAIAGGLKRKSVRTCSKWAMSYRIAGGQLPGPWSFKYHPWSKEMHDSIAPFNVGMKAAQMAYTETLLNRTFFKMDIEGVNCLYALPNKNPDASDFSASRFDPALELSRHLKLMFSDVKNIGHKRAGAANLWIRGSRSRIGFKSIDPSFVALDEVDEMEQDNIHLAYRRTDGQLISEVWAISTPTTPGFGIDLMFQETNQERWMFECPHPNSKILMSFVLCVRRKLNIKTKLEVNKKRESGFQSIQKLKRDVVFVLINFLVV